MLIMLAIMLTPFGAPEKIQGFGNISSFKVIRNSCDYSQVFLNARPFPFAGVRNFFHRGGSYPIIHTNLIDSLLATPND